VDFTFNGESGLNPMEKMKWCETSSNFNYRAISPQCGKQHMVPIGLMFVNHALQHGNFEDLVDRLYLSVGLRVVWGGQLVGEA
jgi:hypothetical protein